MIGFRDAILKTWIDQHAFLFPNLTLAFPALFPTHTFRLSQFVWAMSTVWSRAVDITPPRSQSGGGGDASIIRLLVPLLDMVNHGYGDGVLEVTYDQTSGGTVHVFAKSAFRLGWEIRFNYGDKPR